MSPGELRRIRDRLRPDVDIYPPLSQRIGLVLTEMQRLTEEQYERLDCLEKNDRAIVTGGAGTGKTFLLMQFARRRAARGDRVLVVVHSPTLAAHLRSSVTDSLVTVTSFENVRTLTDVVDLLLVDEGQDLMNMAALAELGTRVKGGLDDGRWCWFMDQNGQRGVDGVFEAEALEYLQSGLTSGRPVKLPLRHNCRNTKQIVHQVRRWTGNDIGVTEVSGSGARPLLTPVGDQFAAALALAKQLDEVMVAGATPGDIGIVTDDGDALAIFDGLPPQLRKLLTPLTVATVATALRGRIVWGPAAHFKGLERPIVFVLALAGQPVEARKASLYVAFTRANYELRVLAHPALAASLSNAERQCLELTSSPGGES